MYSFKENLATHTSVQFSHSIVSDSLRLHGLQHASLLCPSPTPRAYSNSCPLCWWCHPSSFSWLHCPSTYTHHCFYLFLKKALSHFLKLQYAPGSFCVFCAPILELVFSPRNPDFSCWRMGIINHNLGARCNCYWDVIASWIFQLTEQGNICVYTNLCIYIYL